MSIASTGEGKSARKRYARTPEAARYMGISTATLEKDRITGLHKIPFIRLGRAVLYDLDQIDHLLAARTSTAQEGAGR